MVLVYFDRNILSMEIITQPLSLQFLTEKRRRLARLPAVEHRQSINNPTTPQAFTFSLLPELVRK